MAVALLLAPIHFQRSDAVLLRFERHGSVAQAMSLQLSTRLIAVLDIRDVEKRYSVPGNGYISKTAGFYSSAL
jgi:hypothetical protein